MDKYIFKLQRKVAEILEQRLELLSHSNIWELADAIENHITGILDFLLYDLLKNELNSFKKINDSSLEFSINGIDFTINTVFDAKDISNLIVCITPIQHNCDHIFSEQQTVDIISFGKIKKITFIFSNKIEIDRDEILKYLKVASETIYNWVLLRLKSSISDQVIVTNAITNKLQFFLGINNELLKNIWFFVIKNGKGFYIFSQANIDFGLSKMDELLKVKKESSVRLLSEMINLIIPYETTLSVIPLSNDEPYDFIDWPDQAKYSETKQLLIRGERLIFTNDITIYPILNEEKLKFVATTPMMYRKLAEPILTEVKEDLAIIIKEHIGAVQRTVHRVSNSNSNINLAGWGEFVGGFTKGFTSQ